MKKSQKIIIAAGAVFLTLAIISMLTLNVFTLIKVNAVEQNVSQSDQPEQESEDGVVIADQYTVLSTKNISDAYLSGNTEGLSAQDKETLETASDILKDIINGGMSDYDKEYAVFTWIHENIKADEDPMALIQSAPENVSTPQGVLKHKKAVCVGYATTFRLLMQMLDIPCMVVHSNDTVHTWDLVKIDGDWYHADLYSAAGGGGYYYLNLPDSMMDQYWDTSYYPAATEFKNCYMFKNAGELSDIYQIPSELRKKLDGKEGYFSAILKDGNNDTLTAAELIMSDIADRLLSSEEYCYAGLDYKTVKAGSDVLLAVSITYPSDEEEEQDISGLVDEEKLSKEFEKAFGKLTPLEYSDEKINWDY